MRPEEEIALPLRQTWGCVLHACSRVAAGFTGQTAVQLHPLTAVSTTAGARLAAVQRNSITGCGPEQVSSGKAEQAGAAVQQYNT